MPNPKDPSIAPGRYPDRLGRERRAAQPGVQTQWPQDGSAKEGFHCSQLHKWLLHLGGDEADGGKDRRGNVDTLGQVPQKPPALTRGGPR